MVIDKCIVSLYFVRLGVEDKLFKSIISIECRRKGFLNKGETFSMAIFFIPHTVLAQSSK
jgi:hypothetical protein